MLRNPKLEPLSNDAMRKYSPAIFAKEPDSRVSKRYGFIPTYSILEGMHDNGFEPVEVRNYNRRNSAALVHTKHMIRFRQAGSIEARKVGDVVPQIVLINSHDRTSQFELYGGLFRLVCSNGMLVSDGEQVQPIHIRHTANMVEEVVDTSLRIIKQHKNVFKYVDAMRTIELSSKAQVEFARKALALTLTGTEKYTPQVLLAARRKEDEGPQLWHVFNRVQENMTKGGIEGKNANGRKVMTFGVRSIAKDVRLNCGLWALAMEVITKASGSSKTALKQIETV